MFVDDGVSVSLDDFVIYKKPVKEVMTNLGIKITPSFNNLNQIFNRWNEFQGS